MTLRGSNLSAKPPGSRRRIHRPSWPRAGGIGPAESAGARPAQGRWAGRVVQAGARVVGASAQEGRGGARQKGTSNASRSSVPWSQALAISAGAGLYQWARIMAPGGYSAMIATG
jgi:hypothetical protein